MYPDPQRPEIISSIRDAMRQISQEAEAVVELLDVRMKNEHLDGRTEAEDVRTVLELIHNLSLEVSEELDAYQERHAP
jgi:predicted transcriptional regulator